MRLIIVRHYKTTSNENGSIIGWGDSPPVKEWREDIDYVSKALLKSKLKIDRIYTSELRRARNTGLFYAHSHHISKVFHAAEINEIDYGDMSKKSKKWVEHNIPQHKKDPDYCYPNGESFRQMQKRSVQYIRKLAAKHPDEVIMLVVHAGIIRGLICYCLGLDYASNLNHPLGHRYIGIMDFADDSCISYDEIGTASGFVNEGIIKLPYKKK